MRIWALLDDRAGNNSQVLGVAEGKDIYLIVFFALMTGMRRGESYLFFDGIT